MGQSRLRSMMLAAGVALLISSAGNAAYDRDAAISYALNYWDKVCSDGYYFVDSGGPTRFVAGNSLPTTEEGFDCAHFVSCCIGSEPHRPAGGLDIPSRTDAYGEPGAQRLTDWLISQGAEQVNGVSDLLPGDVIAYDADHNGWIEHVALYMGRGLVTAHSLSRYSTWNPNPASDFIFLQLPGPHHVGQVKATLGLQHWLLLVAATARLAASLFFRLH